MDENCKRSGQIPAFGNWDFANELPITQYFECARQAGLVRYSSSSGESDPYVRPDRDLYSLDFKKHAVRNIPPSSFKNGTRNRGRRCPQSVRENANMRKQGRVCDVMEPPRKPISISKQLNQQDAFPRSPPPRAARLPARTPKPVDEDLYKIPPELLRTTKRKKMLGFISCLVPAACVS